MRAEQKVLRGHGIELAIAVVTGLTGWAGPAIAADWRFDDGTQLIWNTTITFGSSWRAENPSNQLYSRADGQLLGLTNGVGGSNTDSSDLNYRAGDRISEPLAILSDVEVRKGDLGFLVRAKAWLDAGLYDTDVRYGSQNNSYNGGGVGYDTKNPLVPYNPCPQTAGTPALPYCPPGTWPRAPLSDSGYAALDRFSGVYLLDAYVYNTFAVGDTKLQLRLGNQVVNWGESLFIQGVNQISPIDVSAAQRPGAEIKELLLPVWMAYGNWGLPVGSLEAFYQFKWEPTTVQGCGSYWAPAEGVIGVDPAGCKATTSFGGQSNPVAQATGFYFPALHGRDAPDSGEFGAAYRFPVEMLDTEFGVYAMNLHARVPVISALMGTHPTAAVYTPGVPFPIYNPAANGGHGGWFSGLVAGKPQYALITPASFHSTLAAAGGTDIVPGGGFWEYPKDIQTYGLSAATTLWSWSVAAELSYQKGVPVQINGNDLVAAALQGKGPDGPAGVAAALKGAGAYLQGYNRFDKTQFQFNGVKTFAHVLGAESLLVMGEAGFQWNNVPDYKSNNLRYGRAFIYGAAGSPALAAQYGQASLAQQNCTVPTGYGALLNPQPDGCKNDGYVTDFAWGYRLRAQLDYLAMGGGLRISPRLFWAHDVEGVSMDGQFNQGRETLRPGLGFVYAKKYTMDLDYTWYAHSAYNPLMDRAFYSISFGVHF